MRRSLLPLVLLPLALLPLAACSRGGDGAPAAPDAPPVPTSALAYPGGPTTYVVGVVAPALAPQVAGDAPAAFAVEPTLPAGLVLDPATGVVTGQPEGPAPLATYTVTAESAAGALTADLVLEVLPELPDARLLVAVHFATNRLSLWRVDGATGTLHAAGAVGVMRNPIRATVHPLGRFVYVASFGGSGVEAHAVDPVEATLEPLQHVSGGACTYDVEVDPTGRFLYASSLGDGRVDAFAIDPDLGTLTPFASLAVATPAGLEVAPDGERLFVASFGGGAVRAFALDPDDGSFGAELGAVAVPSPIDVALSHDGLSLFATDLAQHRVHAIAVDAATGALSSAGSAPTGQDPVSLELDGSRLRVVGQGDGTLTTFLVASDGLSLAELERLELGGAPAAARTLATGGAVVVPDSGGAVLRVLAPDPYPLAVAGELVTDADVACLESPSDVAVVRGRSPLAPRTVAAYAACVTSSTVAGHRVLDGPTAFGAPLGPAPVGPSPTGIAVDPRRRWAFSADQLGHAVSGLALDDETGEPGAAQSTDAGLYPRAAALAPGGEALFAVSNDGLHAYAVSPLGGALVPVATAPAGWTPHDVAVSPCGRFAYVANRASEDVSVFRVVEGAFLELAGSPFALPAGSAPQSLAVAPGGARLAVAATDLDQVLLFDLDPLSGAPALAETLDCGRQPRSVAFAPDGAELAAACVLDDEVARWTLADGASATPLAPLPTGDGPHAVAYAPDGALLVGQHGASSLTIHGPDGASDTVALPPGSGPVDVAAATRWIELEPAP